MIRNIFGYPIMQVPLEQDLEKLTAFAYDVKKTNSDSAQHTNKGGWHSTSLGQLPSIHIQHNYINEEFDNLKASIQQQLKIYHTEFFKNTKFHHNVEPLLSDTWLNINSKHNWNDWHTHPDGIFSGTFYVKHDGDTNGDIIFKNPLESKLEYIKIIHKLHRGAVHTYNDLLSKKVRITPEPNMLLIFPAWLYHKVSQNLNDSDRISLSFDTIIL